MDGLRRTYAEMRKQLAPEGVRDGSARAAANLAEWLAQRSPSGATVAIYRPHEPNRLGECDPSAVARDPRLSVFRFAYPRVVDRFESGMDFAIPMHASDWQPGAFGNLEPRIELPALDPSELDIVVVPGVVFGLAGERIGMGAGFYDRYLADAKSAIRVGFGFDFQVLAEPVPQEGWDARMDFIVTDARVIEVSTNPLM